MPFFDKKKKKHSTYPESLINGFVHLGQLRIRAADMASSTLCRWSRFRSLSISNPLPVSHCDPRIKRKVEFTFTSLGDMLFSPAFPTSDLAANLVHTPKQLLIRILNDSRVRAARTAFETFDCGKL